MKSLILFPPFAFINTPYTSVPILLGQLKEHGIDSTSMDLNLEYFKKMLTKDGIKTSIIKAEKFIENFPQQYKNISSKSKEYKSLQLNEKILIKKRETINSFFKKNKNKVLNSYKYVEYAKSIFKTDSFYNPELLYKAYKILYDATSILFLPYSPTFVDKAFYCYSNTMYSFSYEDVKNQTFDKETNPFIEYYDEEISNGKFDKYDFIAISIPSDSQLIPALTLARMLKAKGKKICIGGNLTTRIVDAFENNPETFDLFVDYVSIGEGEVSLCQLVNAIENNLTLENISGLYYKENNIVKKNPLIKIKEKYKCIFNFDGINLNDYLTPELCLSIQISKGCYWGKCTFCDVFYGKPYFYSFSAKETVEMIEDIINKYNIRNFQFEDESLSPKFCREFAEEIIKRGIDITYASYLRLEKAFDKELLSLMKKSGYVRTIWGYESASERIMNMLNKGIDLNMRDKILKDANDAGIWNHVSFIYNLPTETIEEIEKTINFAMKNKDIVHSFQITEFLLTKHAIITKNTIKDTKTIESKNREFASSHSYRCNNLSKKIQNYILNYLSKTLTEYRCGDLVNLFYFPDYLILYCKKHGAEYIKHYKFKNIKTSENLSCMSNR